MTQDEEMQQVSDDLKQIPVILRINANDASLIRFALLAAESTAAKQNQTQIVQECQTVGRLVDAAVIGKRDPASVTVTLDIKEIPALMTGLVLRASVIENESKRKSAEDTAVKLGLAVFDAGSLSRHEIPSQDDRTYASNLTRALFTASLGVKNAKG